MLYSPNKTLHGNFKMYEVAGGGAQIAEITALK